MISTNRRSKLATRLAFLVSGFGLACWAPLVPLTKERLAIGDGTLGLLLLCIGLGSVIAMQISGPLTARIGAKPIIMAGGMGMALTLPLLAFAPSIPTMVPSLLAFGAFLGALDVAMNVHGVEVEKLQDRPLMSGFHGLFSVGGFAGSTLLTLALSSGVGAATGTVAASIAMIGMMVVATPGFIPTPQTDGSALFVLPKGVVVLLAILGAITFLVEGAMLDWGALFLTDRGLMVSARAGLGYSVFAVAMTAGRFAGDAVVARFGDRLTMFVGGLLAVAGMIVLLLAPIAPLALFGILMIGLGASNIVPVLFRRAGNQTVMPAGLAIASLTMIGYAGVLVGPAAIGFVAQHTGLLRAFWILASLLFLVPLSAKAATRAGAGVSGTSHT